MNTLGTIGLMIVAIIAIAAIAMPLVVILIDSRLAKAVRDIESINKNLVTLISILHKK